METTETKAVTPEETTAPKDITVGKVRSLNHKLGMAIFELVEKFEEETSCAVTRIDLTRTLTTEFEESVRKTESVLGTIEVTVNLLGTGEKK